MAISGEIVGALIEAIAALNLRVDEAVSKQSIQDAVLEANQRTEQKIDVIIDSQIKTAAENWLRENIEQPKDGVDGVNGINGLDGRTPTPEEISLAVDLWFEINRDELMGQDGRNGVDGKDGRDAVDGKDGKDGRNGADGRDGVGIALIEQRDDKSFYITLTDGQEFQIEFPVAKVSGFFGGGGGNGGGISAITSQDGTVTIVQTDSTVDLSVVGGGGSGTVTSVAASGGTTGLAFSGSPITTSGTLTLDGTLGIANGGTGATDEAGARTNLGLGSAATTDASAYATAAQGAKADAAVQSIASTDGSVTITGTTAIDLSVAFAGSTSNVLLPVRNTTGATLTKGTAVYISGATGQISTVSKAIATSDATSAQTLGLITANIANNANGNVTLIGTIANIDTSAYTDGQQLYLSPTTAGTLTATKPYAPDHLVYMAVVEHAHPTQGKLFVKVQNGYEMDELHNVAAVSPSNGQTLVYNSTTSLWEKNTVSLTIGVNGTLPVGSGGSGATSLTGVLIGNGTSAFTTVTAPSGAIVGTTDTQTLTNKRVTQRMNSQSSTTSPFAWNSDSFDTQAFTALANALTISADAGTPTDGQRTIFRFEDNGTARALTWTTGSAKSFRAIGVTLPTTTVAGKTTYVGCIYNSFDSRWDAIAVSQEA